MLKDISPEVPIEQKYFDLMRKDYLAGYLRGSWLYGTAEIGISDRDFLNVVDNSYHDFLSNYPKGIFQFSDTGTYYISCCDEPLKSDPKIEMVVDYEFVSERTFLKMIDANDIVALEAIFLPDGPSFGVTAKLKEYRERYKQDNWKLRESVSSIASNSWVKCKKKLTIEKDYNLRIGQKSLFHSMRLYMFGIQIAQNGKITDYECAADLWKEIVSAPDPTWEYYKEKYQQKFNGLRSELVKLCPRPDEN